MQRTLLILGRITAAATALLAAGLLALAFAPSAFGFETKVVVNGSMGRAMPVGSLIMTKPAAIGDVAIGDVITYRPPGVELPVTHRVIAIETEDGKIGFKTQGDANPAPDPKTVELDSPSVARVEATVPYAGWLIQQAKGPLGGAFLFGIPLFGLLFDKGEPGVQRGRRATSTPARGQAVASSPPRRAPAPIAPPPPPPARSALVPGVPPPPPPA